PVETPVGVDDQLLRLEILRITAFVGGELQRGVDADAGPVDGIGDDRDDVAGETKAAQAGAGIGGGGGLRVRDVNAGGGQGRDLAGRPDPAVEAGRVDGRPPQHRLSGGADERGTRGEAAGAGFPARQGARVCAGAGGGYSVQVGLG